MWSSLACVNSICELRAQVQASEHCCWVQRDRIQCWVIRSVQHASCLCRGIQASFTPQPFCNLTCTNTPVTQQRVNALHTDNHCYPVRPDLRQRRMYASLSAVPCLQVWGEPWGLCAYLGSTTNCMQIDQAVEQNTCRFTSISFHCCVLQSSRKPVLSNSCSTQVPFSILNSNLKPDTVTGFRH